jgi:ketosteroid isomerase-like protein
LRVVNIIADDARAVLESDTDARLKSGKKYDNAYSLIFEFKDGKISEVREYSCSHLVVECFGEFDPDNPEASEIATAAVKEVRE